MRCLTTVKTTFIQAASLTMALSCASTAHATTVTFDWATVGNPGNAGEVQSQGTFGAVNDTYRISKHEVKNSQYTEFLNAVAGTDTNNLYHSSMGSNARGGITQSCAITCTYSLKTNMGNKPVNYVSFFDSMRFVNWLENGQPSGAQGPTTTEAGVYTIGTGVNETRAASAAFFIPSEDEWYKAAYHQPAAQGGDTDDYWSYPTATNAAPTVATANAEGYISNSGMNVANYFTGADWNGQNGNVTTVGSAGAGSTSFYGTFDQGGNVWEWNEAVIGSSERGRRGGSWINDTSFLLSSGRLGNNPSSGDFGIGFRVASTIPEPSADFDNSGIVDGHDFLKWQRGETPGLGSADELALWESQYGTTVPAVVAVVSTPEPSALLLASLTGLIFGSRRRRI